MLIHEHNGLLLWRIEESEERLGVMVTAGDRVSAARFASASRRREHLAWRAALRTVVPDGKVLYDVNGAPYMAAVIARSPQGDVAISRKTVRPEIATSPCGLLAMTATHIGVSHTKDLAAVIISHEKCAVDVERLDRDFSKTRSRFISESDERLPDSGNQYFAAAVWCAKETLYKLSGRRELDLLRDIIITHCDLSNGTITGSISDGVLVTLHAEIMEQWMVVWS